MSLAIEEAQYRLRNNLAVPADRFLPSYWVPNIVNVPVAPQLT